MSEAMLVCYIRASLLHDLGATAPPGGPLSDQKGVFWILLPETQLNEAEKRLPRLGRDRKAAMPSILYVSA